VTRRIGVAVLLVAVGAAAAVVAWRRSGPEASADPGSALTHTTQQFWASYGAARSARAAGRLDEAIEGYSQALTIRPDHEDSLYYLGHCYLEQGQYANALKAYHRLLDVSPKGSSRAYMQIALIHASLDPAAPRDLAAAREYFDRAMGVDSDSGALLGLGEVALLERRWAEARDTLVRADADNPMSIAAPYLLGYLAYREGNGAEAWSRFGTAVQRGELKKAQVKWTEEGDVKADPALRWKALARQSVFGEQWMRLRAYLPAPGPTEADMKREYAALARAIEEAGRAAAPRR
jgi:tetratricopeptide (TPR) repeat protein